MPLKSMTSKWNRDCTLFTAHWLEISHMAVLSCKECWEM